MDRILKEDIGYLANSNMIDWKELTGKSVFITGGTGLIGSQLALTLAEYDKLHNARIKIYVLARNQEKAEKIFKDYKEYVCVVFGNVRNKIVVDENIDYIIHGASITGSKEFVDFPVETIYTGIDGTKNVLEFAKEKKIKGMVYLSSLEVYGITDPDKKSIQEHEYGYIEQMLPRSSYSEGKRMAECLCVAYGHEYGIPVKVARLAQTFGPGVSYADNRVFAQFARCAIEENDIVLKTKGETYRNYCYVRDAITGIFCVLTHGKINEAYNIANKKTGISICDMAHMVSEKIAKNKIKVVFDLGDDLAKLGYGPTIKIALDTSKLENLGWKAEIELEEAFERMIESMKETR